MSKKHALDFIEELKKKKSLQIKLSALEEDDWPGIVKTAKDCGFKFTTTEIKSVIPKEFYKGQGKEPGKGWSEKTKRDSDKN